MPETTHNHALPTLPPLTYRGAALYCEDANLADLAREYGTPLYIYSQARILQNVRQLQAAFAPANPLLCFSVKANNNRALLALLHAQGLGFDVVSGGELHCAMQAGAPAHNIAFAGVGKTDAELQQALQARVGWLNVETAEELKRLEQFAASAGVRQQVVLRLNPAIDADTHHQIATGGANAKFGLLVAEARALAARPWPHLDLCGVHLHIGSQLRSPAATLAALGVALEFMRASLPNATVLDLGGGFPVAYQLEEEVPDINVFATPILRRLKEYGRPLRLLLEPGRCLLADAGALLVTVMAVRNRSAARTIIIDGGMNTLARPAIYGAHHELLPVRHAPTVSPADVAGPICESTDYLARNRSLPALQRGDQLAICTTGAYGYSMASQYNAQPRPAEVLVAEARTRIIRRRETFADLDGADG